MHSCCSARPTSPGVRTSITKAALVVATAPGPAENNKLSRHHRRHAEGRCCYIVLAHSVFRCGRDGLRGLGRAVDDREGCGSGAGPWGSGWQREMGMGKALTRTEPDKSISRMIFLGFNSKLCCCFPPRRVIWPWGKTHFRRGAKRDLCRNASQVGAV